MIQCVVPADTQAEQLPPVETVTSQVTEVPEVSCRSHDLQPVYGTWRGAHYTAPHVSTLPKKKDFKIVFSASPSLYLHRQTLTSFTQVPEVSCRSYDLQPVWFADSL